jgi:hypothetical protein
VKEGERQKDLKFRDAVVAQGKVFVPASLSTSGGFGPKFKQFFGDLVINQSINQSYTLYYSSRRKTEISIVKQDCTQKVNRELTSGVGLQGVHGHKMYWMQRIVTS